MKLTRYFGAGDGTSKPVIPPYQNEIDLPAIQPGLRPGGGWDPPSGPAQPPDLELPYTDPIHLTASATINSTTQGGVNTEALRNPTGAPMEILEVKWQMRSLPPLATNGMASGGVLGCKLELGKIKLTNGFVPIWLFGRCENFFADTPEIVPFGAGAASIPLEFSWKLPRPLFVPSGAVIVPTFEHRGVTQGPVDVQISYSGRQLSMGARPPPVICAPWAASYVSIPFQDTVTGTDLSRETDLVNPFDVPIHLQRFTGRLSVASLAVTVGVANAQIYSDAFTYGAELDMTVTMADSAGNFVVKNALPFRQVFGGSTRSWEVHGIMPPRSFYAVLVQHAARPVGALTFVLTRQCHVGLTGWREVAGGEL